MGSHRALGLADMLVVARRVWQVLRPRSREPLNHEDRSRDRYRRAFWTSVTGAAAKVVSMAVILISVPLTLSYLGSERFGVWMTVASVTAMFGFLDFGVGNGLVTLVAQHRGRDDIQTIRQQILSGYIVVSIAMVLAMLIVWLIYDLIPWAGIFNVKSALAQVEVGPTLVVLFCTMALGLPANLVHKIQSGLQEGVASNIWTLIGSAFSVVGLVFGILGGAGMPTLALCIAIGPLLASVSNTVVFFSRSHPELRPRGERPVLRDLKQLVELGIMFGVLQLAMLITVQAQNIIVAQMLGPLAVTEYATTQRLFVLVPILLGLLLAPLWPAYGEAISRGDLDWARKAFRRSLLVSLALSIPINGLLAFAGPKIVDMWLGGAVAPEASLLIGLAAFGVLTALSGPCAVLLNGIGALRYQAAFAIIMATASVGLGIVLAANVGLPGVIWGATLATLFFSVLPSLSYIRTYFDRQSRCTPRTV